ncbi:MAG: EAL domain-containing protein [Sideroxydans sp.]|nr:EAL domain-containing protein [Sideroxydans sp.]
MPIIWNLPLIVLSVLIAIVGSYTALTHAQRMRENKGRTAAIWMVAGGSTLGVAIWSMHFIGMLAFHLPVPIGFDTRLSVLSLFPAVIAALLGFHVLREEYVKPKRILYSGILMGLGISGMHYLGMGALKMTPSISYEPRIFILSVIMAIAASWGAMFIMYRQDWVKLSSFPRTALGAVVMGVAISSMHYTAMLGMEIPENGLCLTDALRIDPNVMAAMLTMTVLVWFGGGLLASLFDRRMARKNAQELADLEKVHRELVARTEQVSEAMIQALRDSEDRLRMTLQNAPDAVFITEQSGRIEYINDNVIELLGYDRETLYAMTVFDLVPEHWREAYRYGAKQIIATNKRHVFEIRLMTKDGIKIPMELNAVLLPNGRVYGSCRDVRDLKAAQLALEESRFDLQRMMDSITEGMYGVDTEGNCTFVNKAFLTILGFEKAEEVLGQHIHTLIHHSHTDGRSYPANECIMYQAFKINHSVNSDKEVFWRKDGVAVPVEYWSHPILKDDEIIGAVATFLDISERKEKELHIHQLAFYDALTHLANRRLLMERALQALAVSARNGHYGALMLLDLDNFKKLNDSKGHDVGDLLLREVAERLQDSMREGDTVARLGGDEFVVVLEGLSSIQAEAATQAELVAEKIRVALSNRYVLQEYAHQTSPSIGVVIFKGHEETLEALLKYADIAMYQAKQAGRNTIRFYDPAMQEAIDARIELEAELDQALQNDQLHLFYQIQVDSRRRTLGAEVLMRWKHPQRGLVSPAQFIPLAEETGQIVEMGLWALRTACTQLKEWHQESVTCDLTLAVNVSAKQFRKKDFVDQVRRVLVETGAKPSHLKLELTESTVLENVEDTIAKMRELKLLGISFSMDDFGTGYSSLQYLKLLPLDQIKIDQSFVRDITTDPNDAAIVQTIIAMTEALGLNVIAEGVETKEQQAFLEQRGCHTFQGYYFGHPVPLSQFEADLQKGRS